MLKDKAEIFDLLGSSMFLAAKLNKVASEGYELTRITPLFGNVNSAIYRLSRGNYIDKAVFQFSKREQGSLFRCWPVKLRGSAPENVHEELNTYISFENYQGYRLAEIIPLTAFSPDKPGPGSVGINTVFERKGAAGTALTLDKWSMNETREFFDAVPCPVLGCRHVLARMTSQGPNLHSPKGHLENYLCPDHRIYVSPSTFEYENPLQSILWRAPDDKAALDVINNTSGGKRTWSRMGRENDEDSLTWNFFYYLQKNKLLGKFIEAHVKTPIIAASGNVEKAVFWSFDIQKNQVCQDLIAARQYLGESPTHGSEPDLLVTTDMNVILFEIKYNSPVKTKPSKIPINYATPATTMQVFNVTLGDAITQLGYEMVRFFMLGRALQATTGKSFYYVTITKSGTCADLSAQVANVVNHPRFIHLSWAQLQEFLGKIGNTQGKEEAERNILMRYLDAKSAGYVGQKLQHLL